MNNTPIDKDRLKKELSFGKRAVSITSGITTGTPVKRFNDMSTPIEKIDATEGMRLILNGQEYALIGKLAEKINELVDAINSMNTSSGRLEFNDSGKDATGENCGASWNKTE